MRKSSIYLLVLGFAVIVAGALSSVGLVASAQNSNSSTTMEPSNSNTGAKRKPRRHRRTPKPTEPPVDTGAMATETPAAMPRHTGRCDPMQQEQTDLSGTYTGKVKHNDEGWMDATLTVTGNNFTMASGSDTHSGRITAVTTCGYTAVTVMMGDMTPPPPGPNPPPPHPAMSLRAKKVGDSLTLMSVPGEPQKVMFTTGGGAARPRRHRTKRTGAPPPPPPATPPQQ